MNLCQNKQGKGKADETDGDRAGEVEGRLTEINRGT